MISAPFRKPTIKIGPYLLVCHSTSRGTRLWVSIPQERSTYCS